MCFNRRPNFFRNRGCTRVANLLASSHWHLRLRGIWWKMDQIDLFVVSCKFCGRKYEHAIYLLDIVSLGHFLFTQIYFCKFSIVFLLFSYFHFKVYDHCHFSGAGTPRNQSSSMCQPDFSVMVSWASPYSKFAILHCFGPKEAQYWRGWMSGSWENCKQQYQRPSNWPVSLRHFSTGTAWINSLTATYSVCSLLLHQFSFFPIWLSITLNLSFIIPTHHPHLSDGSSLPYSQ